MFPLLLSPKPRIDSKKVCVALTKRILEKYGKDFCLNLDDSDQNFSLLAALAEHETVVEKDRANKTDRSEDSERSTGYVLPHQMYHGEYLKSPALSRYNNDARMDPFSRKAKGIPNRTESSARSPRFRRDDRSPVEEPEVPDIPQKVSRKLDFDSKFPTPLQPKPGRRRSASSESRSQKRKTFSSSAAHVHDDEEVVPIVRKPMPFRSSISSVPKRSMATKMPMRIAKNMPESENDEPVTTNTANKGKPKQKRGRPPRAQTRPYPVERGSDSKKRSNVPRKQTTRAAEPAKFSKKVSNRTHEENQNEDGGALTFYPTIQEASSKTESETYTMAGEEVQAGTSGFQKGKTAEKIVGITTICRPMVYLVKWKNSNTIEPVPSSIMKEKDPSLVIDFLESCIGPKINSLLQ